MIRGCGENPKGTKSKWVKPWQDAKTSAHWKLENTLKHKIGSSKLNENLHRHWGKMVLKKTKRKRVVASVMISVWSSL